MTDSLRLDIIQPDGNAKTERSDAAENRRQIVCTAARLFEESGVASVNMADIAKAAGVGKGTLYRRFANKGELCLSLLDEKLRQFQNQAILHLNTQTVAGVPPLTRLSEFLGQLAHFIVDNIELMVEIDRVAIAGLVQDINTPHFWSEMTIRKLLEQALEHGDISKDLDIPYFTSAILAPLDARILRSHLEIKGYTIDQICAGLGKMVERLER